MHDRTDALQPPYATRAAYTYGFGLIPFRSPLLGESRLISFPPGTEMFQFPGLPRMPMYSACGNAALPALGFPIRESADHGYSAPTRGLSQPFTPFIDSWCLGIHRVPFLS